MPTSVPASTSPAFTGASGTAAEPVPVQSVQLAPAFAVFHTCEVGNPGVLNPMIPTYAVLPVASDESIATVEIAYPFGFTFWVAFSVTFVIKLTPASDVTHPSPPGAPLRGPYPLVTAYTTFE